MKYLITDTEQRYENKFYFKCGKLKKFFKFEEKNSET